MKTINVMEVLRQEQKRLVQESERINNALQALSTRKTRHLSKDARRRIAEAQKKRWAKVRRAA